MLPELTNYLLEKWHDLFVEEKRPQQINYLGISGSIEGGTTTYLGFSNQEERPAFVARILRNPQKLNQFLAERDVLSCFNNLSPLIKNSVPNLILCKRIAGKWVLVESVLEGKPMEVIMEEKGIPKLENTKINLSLVKDWLVAFDKEARVKLLEPRDFIKEMAEEIKEFQKIFSLSEKEQDFLRKNIKIAESFNAQHSFLLHGDFCRQNILVSGNKINIVDWIFAERSTLPLFDFIYFLITYYLQKRKDYGLNSYIVAFKNTFFELNPYSGLVKRFLKEYSQELEIDPSFIVLFLTLSLIKKSVSDYKNILDLSKEGFIPRFPIYLGLKRSYEEALKEQIWIYFFRFLVREERNLIF